MKLEGVFALTSLHSAWPHLQHLHPALTESIMWTKEKTRWLNSFIRHIIIHPMLTDCLFYCPIRDSVINQLFNCLVNNAHWRWLHCRRKIIGFPTVYKGDQHWHTLTTFIWPIKDANVRAVQCCVSLLLWGKLGPLGGVSMSGSAPASSNTRTIASSARMLAKINGDSPVINIHKSVLITTERNTSVH